MTDMFKELQKIAQEEFGCTLVRTEDKTTFDDLFGELCKCLGKVSDIATFELDGRMPCSCGQSLFCVENSTEFDMVSLRQITLAA